MARSEKFINAATTTLDGAINDSVTSITVTDGSIYPSEGDYRLSLEDEIVLVTHRATNVLTVVRGVDGTASASHSDDITIFVIITQGAIDQYVKDFIDPHAFDRTGAHRLLDINGNTLTTSDFTELNVGTGTVSDDTWGGISHAMQFGATTNIRLIHKSAPSTPYVVEAHILHGFGLNASSSDNVNGIGWRESSSGKLTFLGYHIQFGSFVVRTDSPTASGPASTTGPDTPARNDYWLRIEDDGTNLAYKVSADGLNYFEFHTELRGFHFDTGPNQLIWCGDNQGTSGELVHLLSWIES